MHPSDPSRDARVEAALAAALAGARRADGAAGRESAGADPDPELAALVRQARALVDLPRRTAPRELDGRVVAALHAGAREDRAAAALARLAPRPAPVVLDRLAAEAVDPLRAPRALDALVAARLAEPAEGLARAALGRLPRLAAPASLAARLAAPGGLDARSAARGRRRGPWAHVARASLAAAAALAVFVATLAPRGSTLDPRTPAAVTTRAPLARSFEFVGHASLDELALSPPQRALAGALIGEVVGGGS